jgi:acyl-CoA synthetase (AMP-forming)/AMP-acid ligase II
MAALRGAGLSPGDRVAFVLGNRRETFEALLACVHAGFVAVPVNWRLTAPEIAYIFDDSSSRVVITELVHAETVANALALADRPAGIRVLAGEGSSPGFIAIDDLPTDSGEDVSGGILLYTSGTTGQPKGVVNPMLSAGAPLGAVAATTAGLSEMLDIPAGGVSLLAGPWHHSAQLFFSLFPLLDGCSVVMRRRFDAAEVLDLIDSERVNIGHMVPTQFLRMLRLDEGRRRALRADSLVRIWHGGGVCPVDTKRRMIDWWGPIFVEYYGATEAGIITMIDSAEWLQRPGTVGRAVPPTEIVIAGPDGQVLPPGQDGRVAIRRPPGRGFHYHEAPEKTANAHLAPNMFTVGDIGHLDDEGYLYLTARSIEIIVSGGVNIYPAEIEAVLLAHGAVDDAIVFGGPDEEFGEQVVALIESNLSSIVDQEELSALLDAHCRASLAGFKVPRRYEFVPELPREPTGKIAKGPLRERYWRDAGRSI